VGQRLLGAELTASIRLINLTLGYDRHPAVHHLDGEIVAGAALAVCGPNGAGKSTLLKGLAGLITPLGGRIDFGGLPARAVGYLPQATEIDRSFPISLQAFVAMGAIGRIGLFGHIDSGETARTQAAIARVGLSGLEARPIGALSGGQMQRMLFARLIVQDQPVILLDEPFGAIDEATIDDLLDLISHWAAEGRSVVAVLHDLELARRAFPRALLLARSCIAWGPTGEALASGNLARARAMSEAYDQAARECLIDEAGSHVH
jgi:zinc/manganese transport system ATP-binding protein